MNPPKFGTATEELRRALPARTEVRAAAVFGSVARGEATEDSDLDLLVVLERPEFEGPLYRDLAVATARHDVDLSMVATDASFSGWDRQFVDSVLRDAVPIKGSLPSVAIEQLGLEPYRIVRYSLRGLQHAEKLRLNRQLFGYATRKTVGRRVYRTSRGGVLAKVGGRSLGRGVVLVPERGATEVDALLARFRVDRVLLPAWIQRP